MLALRLLNPADPTAPDSAHVQLLPARLPDRLPVQLPLPDKSRLIGSQIRGKESITVLLDSDQLPEAVLAFYRDFFTRAGWALNGTFPGGGFTSALQANSLTLCKGEQDPAIFVTALQPAGQPTDVRVSLALDPSRTPCGLGSGPSYPSQGLIPRLVFPADAQLRANGETDNSDYAESLAAIETTLDIGSLAGQMESQLEGAGWALRARNRGGPAAWSTWTVRDSRGQTWRGLFVIVDLASSPPQRYLFVRVDLER
jgi:hypothetical protein